MPGNGYWTARFDANPKDRRPARIVQHFANCRSEHYPYLATDSLLTSSFAGIANIQKTRSGLSRAAFSAPRPLLSFRLLPSSVYYSLIFLLEVLPQICTIPRCSAHL